MANYAKGKIYKLHSDVDDLFYIGSTTRPCGKRKANHKKKAEMNPNRKVYQHFNEIGWGNVKISVIEKYPSTSKEELETRERYYIDLFKPQLNTSRPTLTEEEKEAKKKHNFEKLKEYIKQNPSIKKRCDKNRYEAKKEEILKQKHEYYETNKEAKKEWQRNYRQVNQEEISMKKKARVNCPHCSKEVCKGALSRHVNMSCRLAPRQE